VSLPKAYALYHPVTFSEVIKRRNESLLEEYPLMPVYSVKLIVVPTLATRLVREQNLFGIISNVQLFCFLLALPSHSAQMRYYYFPSMIPTFCQSYWYYSCWIYFCLLHLCDALNFLALLEDTLTCNKGESNKQKVECEGEWRIPIRLCCRLSWGAWFYFLSGHSMQIDQGAMP
jgi:hypothetical protein